MKLRISDKHLRFRIGQEELEQLLESNLLTLTLPLMHYPQTYHVRLEETKMPLDLCEEQSKLTLIAGRHMVEALRQRLPSRKGIEHVKKLSNGSELKLDLEVELKKSSKA